MARILLFLQARIELGDLVRGRRGQPSQLRCRRIGMVSGGSEEALVWRSRAFSFVTFPFINPRDALAEHKCSTPSGVRSRRSSATTSRSASTKP